MAASFTRRARVRARLAVGADRQGSALRNFMAVRHAGKISDLTPRELEILRLIVAGRLKHKLSARSGMDLMRIALTVRT
jgi:DNA-binding NarL/FixJ family response regulator